MIDIKADPNGRVLYEGVEPLTTEFLVKQGHRYVDSCPNYVAINVFMGMPAIMSMSGPSQAIAVAAMACSCGVIVRVPLG